MANYKKVRGGFRMTPAFAPVVRYGVQQIPKQYAPYVAAASQFVKSPVGQLAVRTAGKYVKKVLSSRTIESQINAKNLPHNISKVFNPTQVHGKGTGISESKYKMSTPVSAKLAAYLGTCQKKVSIMTNRGVATSLANQQHAFAYRMLDFPAYTRAIADVFTGSGTIDDPTATLMLAGNNATESIVFARVDAKLHIQTRYESNIIVKIYDLVAKHDMPTAPASDPVQAWRDGLDALVDGTASSYNVLESLPTMSPYFNAYWSVTNVTEINLQAGGGHLHELSYAPHASINQLRATTVDNYGHLTRAVMIVLSGHALHGAGAETNSVLVGSAGIDVFMTSYTTTYTPIKGRGVYHDYSTYQTVANEQTIADIGIEPDVVT